MITSDLDQYYWSWHPAMRVCLLVGMMLVIQINCQKKIKDQAGVLKKEKSEIARNQQKKQRDLEEQEDFKSAKESLPNPNILNLE